MRAGALNRRVTIQQLAAGQDALGQPVQTWSAVATVWANIRYETGAETIRSDKDTAIAKVSIRLRRRTDVTNGMRALYGATVFAIKAVLQDERDREHTDLVCEVVSG